MAVQAQYPSNIPMADFCLRARQIYNKASNNGVNPFTYAPPTLEDLQQFQLLNGSGGSNQLVMMNSIAAGPVQQNTLNGVPFSDAAQQVQHEFICNNINASNKRPRQSDFLSVHQQQQQQQQQQQHHQQPQQQRNQHAQQQQQQLVQDYHRTPVVSRPLPNSQAAAAAAGVNTGLRLAFPDDRLSSSSAPPAACGKLNLHSAALSLLNEEIALELQRQREEIEQMFRVQEEQMRRAIEEKQQQQSRSLLASIERFVSRKLREKDMEIDKANRKSLELEERVKHLTMEARLWQNKAKNGEAMVASLRNNLQQAVALGREQQQSREGIGDTDADDAESSHPDDAADAHARTYRENKELREKRTCKVCRSREVSILLLPCRHLCLCKDCESKLDACPLCRHTKNASVQVYMS